MVSIHQKMSEICPPDFSMWTTEDDLLLKNAVEAGAALEALAKGAVRFSHRFTIKELQERWYALLYIPEISAKAAARMVEFELSQMELSKPTRSSKLKSNEDIIRKQRPESVRNRYYNMRKRIDAERILSVDDNCIFANQSAVTCIGSANGGFQEIAATIDAVCPATVDMEGTVVAPSFGFSCSSLDIEDRTFSQMVSFLATGEVEAVGSAFTTNSMDSLEVNSAGVSAAPNGCYDFSRHHPSNILSDTVVGGGNEHISVENVNQLLEDMPQDIVENAATIHHMPYIVESRMPSDATKTALTADNVPIVSSVPVFDHNPGECKTIGTRFVRTGHMQEASAENASTLDMLSQPTIGGWEVDAVLLMPSMIAGIKDNVDEQIKVADDEADVSGLKEPQRDGCLMLNSSTTKEAIHLSSEGLEQSLVMEPQHESLEQSAFQFLSTSSEGAHVYGSGDGHDMLDKVRCLNTGYNNSVTPVKVEPQPEPSECLDIKAVDSLANCVSEKSICEQSRDLDIVSASPRMSVVPTQVSQEWKNDAAKLGGASFTFHDTCQPLLFVHGPMVCTLNTEDSDVPCNDDFVPLAYQELSPVSAAFQFSYTDQINAGGSLTAKGMPANQRPIYSGSSIVKKEHETLEKLMEAENELQPAALKDEENNKSCIGYNRIKMEVFEFTAPSVVCQEEVARKEDCNPGIASSTVLNTALTNVLQEGISTAPSVVENNSGDKIDMLPSHESIEGPLHDGSVDFSRPLKFEVTLPTIQDNIVQVYQDESLALVEVGFKDSQILNSEETAVHPLPGSQQDQFSDSDEELPQFSDVEAMILDMDLDPGEDESFSAIAESKRLYKHHKRALVRLEQAANSAMQRSLASKGAFAVLYGRHLKYFIKKNEVSIGRETLENIVDIDLTRKDRPNKVSRRQATIKLKEDGLFYLENYGKRVISVNSHNIASGQRIRLSSNCLIEIGGMRFIFEMDKRLANKQFEPIPQGRFCG